MAATAHQKGRNRLGEGYNLWLPFPLYWDSDKLIFERLQKEFEAARTARIEVILIDDEQWNDGLLATIREKVHMEADRKAMANQANLTPDPQFQLRTTYRIKNKVIYCLDGARIGIQYETYFAGEPCELYHCVLESKSFLEKMTVIEHTLPFFLPIREVESDLLSSNAIKFIDHLEEILQSYVDRREQGRGKQRRRAVDGARGSRPGGRRRKGQRRQHNSQGEGKQRRPGGRWRKGKQIRRLAA
ncbi:hypothetical protein GUJ93_ZPchr0015g6978 [Zizania palustris]|uniref:Uncharacterized protein n=1 Tax=Zizania palustris TaxID=103762 RepID=A0A8J5SYR5_ZIZPA|nr:hypothetical protein GUJ93_ZPchr0015g6978 [Zizania palustris]